MHAFLAEKIHAKFGNFWGPTWLQSHTARSTQGERAPLRPPSSSSSDGTEAPRGKSLTRVCRFLIQSSSLLTLGGGET